MSVPYEIREERPFQVLFVCTANQCRSPLAEHLLRSIVSRSNINWAVGSAGVRARDGADMHPHAATVLREREIASGGWITRRLSAARIAAADLVLTAEAAHRHIVATAQPAAVRYTFTLLQFTRLLSLTDLAPANGGGALLSGPELIRKAELARSRPQARDNQRFDLKDPLGGSLSSFRATAKDIDAALLVLERALHSAPAGEQLRAIRPVRVPVERESFAGRPRPR